MVKRNCAILKLKNEFEMQMASSEPMALQHAGVDVASTSEKAMSSGVNN